MSQSPHWLNRSWVGVELGVHASNSEGENPTAVMVSGHGCADAHRSYRRTERFCLRCGDRWMCVVSGGRDTALNRLKISL